jgi:hypothetical protein
VTAPAVQLEADGDPYLPVKPKTEDWCTPPEILDPVRRIFGGTIDFDPCSNPHSIVGAKREVMLPTWNSGTWDWAPGRRELVIFGDGLEVPWLGNAFFNPPYSPKPMGEFMRRALVYAPPRDTPCASSIGFVPSKTSGKAWQDSVPGAQAVCFLNRRVRHLMPDGSLGDGAPFHQALVLWTSSRELVHCFCLELDGRLGHVMVPA